MSTLRRTLCSTALVLTITPATAPAEPLTWGDVLSPDRVAQHILQYGIMALRTQLDLQYGDLSANLLSGRVTITDLQMLPLPEWDGNADCNIRVDRLTINQAPLDEPGRIRLKASVYGISAPAICLPPDVRPALQAAGIDEMSLPYLSFDVDYDVATSGARIQAHGVAEGLAAFDLTADFSYLWFDGRDDPDEPVPVFELSSGTISIENTGLWDKVKGMIPPPFTNPTSAIPMIQGVLTGALEDMNRDGAGNQQDDPGTLSGAQVGFVDSFTTTWAAFLKSPQRLILETGFAPDENRFLDLEAYEADPRMAFEDLQPRFVLVPAQVKAALPADMLRLALGDDAASLGADDRLRIGQALVSGVGAPRNIAAGTKLLVGLARDGSGPAALALSDALETRQPDIAYGWSLRAGAAGQSGATARLDRLESVLSLTQVLKIQNEVSKGTKHPLEALANVAAIKRHARARLTGKGMARSYGIAVMWAMLAAATGDAEAADMLDEIDTRIRHSGAEDAQVWAAIEAESSRLAMEIWLSRDLPTAFGTAP
ncbi:MAG: hypothetical protein ACI8R4_002384 [Paracoccaceae bacterium]|jgi:hypothetical protein